MVSSLGWCKSCLILDENLKVKNDIPSISNSSELKYSSIKAELTEKDNELTELKSSIADAEEPLPQLIDICKTIDQVIYSLILIY